MEGIVWHLRKCAYSLSCSEWHVDTCGWQVQCLFIFILTFTNPPQSTQHEFWIWRKYYRWKTCLKVQMFSTFNKQRWSQADADVLIWLTSENLQQCSEIHHPPHNLRHITHQYINCIWLQLAASPFNLEVQYTCSQRVGRELSEENLCLHTRCCSIVKLVIEVGCLRKGDYSHYSTLLTRLLFF